jgi:AraC-like DNA-binding protein/mannose-6-phosphate isomerase-like protein (cupin superfamily)
MTKIILKGERSMPAVKSFSTIRTDETLMETAQHGDSAFPFQYYYEDIWDFDFHCVDWHWHPELEYVYVESGQAICFTGDDKIVIPAGNALLINSKVIHRFEAKESTIIPNAVYSPFLLASEGSRIYRKYIYPFIANGPDSLLFDAAVPWQNLCIRLMMKVFDLQYRNDSEIDTLINLLAFWNEVSKHRRFEGTTGKTAPGRETRVRLQIMMQFIQEHFRENIHLEDIAAAVHIGKSTALQAFHQGIAQSPIEYLIRYRLKQAAILLTSTGKTIAAIAEETGFESSTYFCRKFKELYRMTPTAYRNRAEN